MIDSHGIDVVRLGERGLDFLRQTDDEHTLRQKLEAYLDLWSADQGKADKENPGLHDNAYLIAHLILAPSRGKSWTKKRLSTP